MKPKLFLAAGALVLVTLVQCAVHLLRGKVLDAIFALL